MIQLFKSLLGETSRDHRTSARPKPTPAKADYRAVSLAPNIACDVATKDAAAGKRYLQREAPRLPMAGCPSPASCSCRFKKHADRRDADRRLLGLAETNRWYGGAERRNRGGRRSKTN